MEEEDEDDDGNKEEEEKEGEVEDMTERPEPPLLNNGVLWSQLSVKLVLSLLSV